MSKERGCLARSNLIALQPLVARDLEYMAALGLASALNVLPSSARIRIIHQLSRIAGTILYKTNRETVRRVRRHLQLLFARSGRARPHSRDWTGSMLECMVRDQLVLASWNALILHLLPSLRDRDVVRIVQVKGLHHLDELRASADRGPMDVRPPDAEALHPIGPRDTSRKILLLGAHVGPYGYAVAAALCAQGYPAWLVGYGSGLEGPAPAGQGSDGGSTLYNRFYWPRLQRLSQRLKTATIDHGGCPTKVGQHPTDKERPGDKLAEILEKTSDIIYLLADQYFIVRPNQECPPNLVALELLNHTVYLDASGVQVAKKMGAQPLTALPVSAQRVLIEPIEWAGSGTTTADIARDLQVYLNRLEQALLEDPALWRDLRRHDLLPRMGVFNSEFENERI